jgi:hypothetical protein
VSSPLVDMEAVPATAPRIEAIDGRLRLVTPKPAPAVVLLFGCALALVVVASLLRGRRPVGPCPFLRGALRSAALLAWLPSSQPRAPPVPTGRGGTGGP